MGHFANDRLHLWKQGDMLTAELLNGNFLELRDLAEQAMGAALTPDPVAVTAEVEVTHLRRRLDALERLLRMRARDRNEREYTPLAYYAAVLVRLDDMQAQIEDAINRVDQLNTGLATDREDLHRRLLRVEQQPEAAPKEDVAILLADHDRVALECHTLGAVVAALRHEVGILSELALGRDRLANRMEYAPLGYVAELLRRVEKLEARDG